MPSRNRYIASQRAGSQVPNASPYNQYRFGASRCTGGLTTNHPSDSGSHGSSVAHVHRHFLSDLQALSRPRRHSTCRLRLPQRWCRHREIPLEGGSASVPEEQVAARRPGLHRAVVALGRMMEGGPMNHLPRQASPESRRSRSLHRPAQSVHLLVLHLPVI